MADPIVVPALSLWEVRMNGFIDEQQTITTWHYLNRDEVADLNAATLELATTFGVDNWNARIRPALSVKYEGVFIAAQCIRPIRYRDRLYLPANRTGSIAGDSLPSGVSVVIRRTTPRSGRSQQGRIYLPGIPSSAVDASALTNAYFTAHSTNLKDAVTENLTLPIAGEFVSVIFHPGAVTLNDEITLSKMDPTIRYQRRRELGVGI